MCGWSRLHLVPASCCPLEELVELGLALARFGVCSSKGTSSVALGDRDWEQPQLWPFLKCCSVCPGCGLGLGIGRTPGRFPGYWGRLPEGPGAVRAELGSESRAGQHRWLSGHSEQQQLLMLCQGIRPEQYWEQGLETLQVRTALGQLWGGMGEPHSCRDLSSGCCGALIHGMMDPATCPMALP